MKNKLEIGDLYSHGTRPGVFFLRYVIKVLEEESYLCYKFPENNIGITYPDFDNVFHNWKIYKKKQDEKD